MDINSLMATFHVSEWDWFCLRLQLHALDTRGGEYSVYYDLSKPESVYCRIYSEHTAQLLEMQASTQEQLEYYRDWVQREKQFFEEVMKQLPSLSTAFETEQHVIFQIMHPDPAVDKVICDFRKRQIVWNKMLVSGF